MIVEKRWIRKRQIKTWLTKWSEEVDSRGKVMHSGKLRITLPLESTSSSWSASSWFISSPRSSHLTSSGSTILSADFLGHLYHAHRKWTTLSIVWHRVRTHVGVGTCDECLFLFALLLRGRVADVTLWKPGAVARLICTVTRVKSIIRPRTTSASEIDR